MSLTREQEILCRKALAAYLGPQGAARVSIRPIGDGLINDTYLVEGDHSGLQVEGPLPRRSVLQRVNPLFDISVHEDIEAITAHLAAQGMPTLRLYRTREEGALAVEVEALVPVEEEVLVPRPLGGAAQPAVPEAAELAESEEEAGPVLSAGEARALAVEPSGPLPRLVEEGEAGELPFEAVDPWAGEPDGWTTFERDPEEDEATDPRATSFEELRAAAPAAAPEAPDEEEALNEQPPVAWSAERRVTQREERGVFRLCTYLPGESYAVVTPSRARAAGRLVGRFHQALAGLAHEFAFSRPGAHDLSMHLMNLRDAVRRARAQDGFLQVAEEIAARAEELPARFPGPLRICHGDLKISNVRFDERERAYALLDLDTLSYLPLGIELGDALRSWCNPSALGEDDPEAPFDAGLFGAAMAGYAESARGLLLPEEREALVAGVERIALELAARFCADVVNDRYFRWNAQRFPSRAAHNLVRARGQLSLARSIAAQRPALEAQVADLLLDRGP